MSKLKMKGLGEEINLSTFNFSSPSLRVQYQGIRKITIDGFVPPDTDYGDVDRRGGKEDTAERGVRKKEVRVGGGGGGKGRRVIRAHVFSVDSWGDGPYVTPSERPTSPVASTARRPHQATRTRQHVHNQKQGANGQNHSTSHQPKRYRIQGATKTKEEEEKEREHGADTAAAAASNDHDEKKKKSARPSSRPRHMHSLSTPARAFRSFRRIMGGVPTSTPPPHSSHNEKEQRDVNMGVSTQPQTLTVKAREENGTYEHDEEGEEGSGGWDGHGERDEKKDQDTHSKDHPTDDTVKHMAVTSFEPRQRTNFRERACTTKKKRKKKRIMGKARNVRSSTKQKIDALYTEGGMNGKRHHEHGSEGKEATQHPQQLSHYRRPGRHVRYLLAVDTERVGSAIIVRRWMRGLVNAAVLSSLALSTETHTNNTDNSEIHVSNMSIHAQANPSHATHVPSTNRHAMENKMANAHVHRIEKNKKTATDRTEERLQQCLGQDEETGSFSLAQSGLLEHHIGTASGNAVSHIDNDRQARPEQAGDGVETTGESINSSISGGGSDPPSSTTPSKKKRTSTTEAWTCGPTHRLHGRRLLFYRARQFIRRVQRRLQHITMDMHSLAISVWVSTVARAGVPPQLLCWTLLFVYAAIKLVPLSLLPSTLVATAIFCERARRAHYARLQRRWQQQQQRRRRRGRSVGAITHSRRGSAPVSGQFHQHQQQHHHNAQLLPTIARYASSPAVLRGATGGLGRGIYRFQREENDRRRMGQREKWDETHTPLPYNNKISLPSSLQPRITDEATRVNRAHDGVNSGAIMIDYDKMHNDRMKDRNMVDDDSSSIVFASPLVSPLPTRVSPDRTPRDQQGSTIHSVGEGKGLMANRGIHTRNPGRSRREGDMADSPSRCAGNINRRRHDNKDEIASQHGSSRTHQHRLHQQDHSCQENKGFDRSKNDDHDGEGEVHLNQHADDTDIGYGHHQRNSSKESTLIHRSSSLSSKSTHGSSIRDDGSSSSMSSASVTGFQTPLSVSVISGEHGRHYSKEELIMSEIETNVGISLSAKASSPSSSLMLDLSKEKSRVRNSIDTMDPDTDATSLPRNIQAVSTTSGDDVERMMMDGSYPWTPTSVNSGFSVSAPRPWHPEFGTPHHYHDGHHRYRRQNNHVVEQPHTMDGERRHLSRKRRTSSDRSRRGSYDMWESPGRTNKGLYGYSSDGPAMNLGFRGRRMSISRRKNNARETIRVSKEFFALGLLISCVLIDLLAHTTRQSSLYQSSSSSSFTSTISSLGVSLWELFASIVSIGSAMYSCVSSLRFSSVSSSLSTVVHSSKY